MGRRKNGRDISGWVIVDKPAGVGSTSIVNKVRWAFNARKAGHAGTLDPAATGVLAIALGEATKTIPAIADAEKAYRFTVTLGAATSTDDAEGEILARSDVRPSTAQIEAALPEFRGDILQVPPQYSAVRVNGVRAYHKARGGEVMDLDARPLRVSRLEVVGRPDDDHVTLEMICGKGGYVRSIARDLGAVLGCLAHVRDLRRIWSGPFNVSEAVSLSEVEGLARDPEIDRLLQPVEAGLSGLPEIRINAVAAQRVTNGNAAEVATSGLSWGDAAWASHDGAAVAIGRFKGGYFHPDRVFAR